jgi:tetratricopeptide (TPR) repeat protein
LPHQVLGQVYLWKKQHEQAIAEAERAIALDPNNADAYVNLGNILPLAGRGASPRILCHSKRPSL